MKSRYLKFLLEKIHNYSFLALVRLEIESLFFGILSLAPTTIGILLRGVTFFIFSRRCGGFPWIQPRVTIIHADRIRVGSNFGVNSGTYINGIGGITFGDYVLIGSNVTISSGMHPIEDAYPPIFARGTTLKGITIEDDVWIGAGAVIMPGVHIAKGTVIGANAVVTKDTEAYSVMVGAPAKKLRVRHDSKS